MADDRTAPHPAPAQATITSGMVALFEATHPQLSALHKSVVLHAARHPTGPVPAGLVADAGALLAATRRLISRQRSGAAGSPSRLRPAGPSSRRASASPSPPARPSSSCISTTTGATAITPGALCPPATRAATTAAACRAAPCCCSSATSPISKPA